MPNNNHIPNNDLELARDIGALLDENRSIASIEDPLVDRILDHKKDLYSAFEHEIEESRQQSWQKISAVLEQTRDENQGATGKNSIFHLSGWQKSAAWKVAATILIAAVFSIFYLQSEVNQPKILAESASEIVTYTLNDDSRVQLRPNSTLSLVEKSDDEVRYALEGEAFFNVTKNNDRRFLVNAGQALVEVVGTSFNVREWNGETTVYLQEGTLLLSSVNRSEQVELKPGEVATATTGLKITPPAQTDGREYLSWTQNQLILDNRTAGTIINEIEYHYSINIQAPQRIRNEVLGGTLSLENRSVTLENLGIVLGGNFSSIGDDTYQFVE